MAGKLKKLTPSQVDESVVLYDSGMSLGDIGHLYGVTRQAMWDLLRRRTTLRDNRRWAEQNHFFRGGRRADSNAHNILERAIKSGELVNPDICSICGYSGRFDDGRNAIQGHHDDYNKPLSVRWLCQKCHHEWHKTNSPTPIKEGGEKGSLIDIIVGGFP